MAKNYKAAILITGDNTGGVKAIKATRQQIDGLNKSVDKSGKSFKSYTSRTNASTKALNSLKEQAKLAAGAIGLGLLVDRAVKAADTMTQLNARLELATDTTAQFQEAQARLIEISRNTYTAIDTNVTLYSRMAIATKDLAIDQETLFKATESLQNSFRAYGTSTEEAASATLQLTQAMAKGKLDGDEFRSVMENAPLVMTALTKELNITKKELFEFSRTGRLQVQDLVAALANSADEFAAQSAKIPQTIAEAFTGLNREFTLMVGNADKATGATTLVTKSINLLAENLSTLISVAAGGAALKLLGPMIGKIGTSLLASAVAAERFGVGLVALNAKAALTTKALSGLKGAMALVGGPAGVALLGGYALWQGISNSIEQRAERLRELSQVSEEAAIAIDNFINSASGSPSESNSLTTMASEIELIKNKLEDLQTQRQTLLNSVEYASGYLTSRNELNDIDAQTKGLELQLRTLESMSQIAPKLKPVWEGIDKIGDAWVWLAEKGKEIEATLTGQVESVDKWIESQTEQLASLQKQNEYFGKSAEQVLLLEAAKQKLLTTDEEQRKKIDALTAAVIKETKALEDKEKALEAQNDAIELAMDLNKEYATDAEQLAQIESARIEAIDLLTDNHEALAAAGIDLSKVIDKVNKRAKEQTTAVKGTNDVWEDYYQLMQDLGMIDQVAFEFTQMEMALEELAMSGQFSQAQLDALREAMYRYREAAEAGTQSQVEFNRSIRGVNADGGFTSDASFNDLINQGMTLGDVLSEAGKGFSQGLEGGLNSMNVLLQGVETIMGVWDSTAGQDSLGRVTNTAADLAASGMFGPIAQAVGQIAQTVNALTGGRLFGTSFETESQRTNIELGQGGFSGTNTLREVRQRSWFRGREWQETVNDIGADMQASLDAFYNEILQVRQAGAAALGVTLNTPIVTGSYVEEYDADGNITRQGSTFNGRFFNEDSQAFQIRAMAENIVDLLGSAFEPIEREVTRLQPVYDDYGRLIGSFSRTMTIMVNEADQLANRWRHDAQLFLDGSQMLLAAGADILDGNGLFESLTAVANVIQDMAKPGEALTDAYMRVQSSVLLLDDALDVIGASFDMARVDYVRFAADITDAAGGIQEAAGLWQNYFENFYTEPELNEIRLGQSSDLLAQQAGNLGLDADMTMAEFRQLFNEQMPNLTAEQIAQWLEFAETLVRVTDLEEQRTAALQAELEALQAYNDFAGSITDQIAELTGNGASDFENRIAEIDSGLQSNIDSLYELAAAAGLAEPAQEDLSNAYRLAALQTAEAIGLLRDATQSLIDELYGDQAQSV